MSYKDSDYTIVIALICWLESMHFCAETHLDDGDFSVFVFPSTTIARVPHLNILWKYSSQETLSANVNPILIQKNKLVLKYAHVHV